MVVFGVFDVVLCVGMLVCFAYVWLVLLRVGLWFALLCIIWYDLFCDRCWWCVLMTVRVGVVCIVELCLCCGVLCIGVVCDWCIEVFV